MCAGVEAALPPGMFPREIGGMRLFDVGTGEAVFRLKKLRRSSLLTSNYQTAQRRTFLV